MIEAQRSPSLTPEAYQMAATYQLGMPTTEYGPSRFTTKKTIAMAFWLVITVGLTVLCIIYSQFSLALLMAACAVIVPLIVLGDRFLSRDKRVYVCPGGLLYLHGGKTDAIRWDQVEAVWQRVTRRTTYGIQVAIIHLYTLRRNDGAKFKFDDHLGNVEALGKTIVTETASLLWLRYIAAYRAGQTVTFGSFSLNQQGVSKGNDLLPWQEVREIKANRGFIVIWKAGNPPRRWKTVAASQIPNVNVFLALVDSIVSGGRR
jgi:hypothetical protein